MTLAKSLQSLLLFLCPDVHVLSWIRAHQTKLFPCNNVRRNYYLFISILAKCQTKGLFFGKLQFHRLCRCNNRCGEREEISKKNYQHHSVNCEKMWVDIFLTASGAIKTEQDMCS
jgi:hypothetical protein